MPDKSNALHEFTPDEVWKWKLMEDKFDQVLKLHDYLEVRLSILQDRELIQKGITALMQGKEPGSAGDRTLDLCRSDGDPNQLSLRPEGTISVLQYTAKHYRKGDIHRYYYHGPMFRSQRGGVAEVTNQLGIELLGSDSVFSENEVISLGMRLLREMGFREASLRLNSYGCLNCRSDFYADVCAYLEKHKKDYCQKCYEELCANPFADTHCKLKSCQHDAHKGPQIVDYLCDNCQNHFRQIQKTQANLGHPYKVDPCLYKNFSYYNAAVFDFVINGGGHEVTAGGGGRYDFLSERITGRKIPAVGFYLDLDEIFRLMDNRGLFRVWEEEFAVYICAQSPNMDMMMLQIAQELHTQNIKTVLSPENRSTDLEIKHARSHKCHLMVIIREDNIRDGKLLLHNLNREDQAYIPLNRVTEAIDIARRSLKKQ
ncbi:MAG: ATP phosphoribosyltransferase regulatory subunit [Candidatus Syntrophosphaera sp.]